MKGGKDARQTQPVAANQGPRASEATTSSRANPTPADVSEGSSTQLTAPDVQSLPFTGIPSESNSGGFQDVLVDCNTLIESYRKGEVTKASVYVDIQSKLTQALGDDRTRTDAAFGSFISTIESHDAEVAAASKRGGVAAHNAMEQSPSPPASV
jgi:hypothetical protein